jgi:virginiamycin B lyase
VLKALALAAVLAVPAPRIQATIAVGGQPTWLEAAAGSLWVANYGASELERIDPATNKVRARIRLGGAPYAVSFGAGSLWVSSFGSTFVSRVDPATNKVVARIELGADQQAGILATPSAVWVAVFGSGELVRIDPGTNQVVARIKLGGNPEAAVLYAGSLWVPNENRTMTRLDPASGRVLARIRVGSDPDNVLPCHGLVWTTDLHGTQLTAVSPATNKVVRRIRVGSGSVGLACGRALWTASYDRGLIIRVDPTRGRITGQRAVGLQSRAVLLGWGSVWVANQASGNVVRLAP